MRGAYSRDMYEKYGVLLPAMIVDVHTHFRECPCPIGEEFIHDARVTAGAGCKDNSVDLDKHWEAMQAVVLGFRARDVGVLVPNEYVAGCVHRHPERLIGFCSVDPHGPAAVDQLDHAVQGLKLRGLKMAPIYQNVSPTDYGFAVSWVARSSGFRCSFVRGTTFCSNVSLEIANPVQLQPLALEFPRLRMVIAHVGHPWINETLVLIRKNRAMYADISAQYYRPWQFYNALVAAMEHSVLDRRLLGSDYPFPTRESTLAALGTVNEMVEGTRLPRIPEAKIDALIHRDSLDLLGIA
jgi:predicted TIM-barrel fold metal-dependent hydrolase